MKQNKAKLYAEALAAIIIEKKAEGPERSRRTVDNFVKLLVKAGYEKKAKEILTLTEDIVLKRKGNKKITLETARKLTAGHKAMLKVFVKDGDIVNEKINQELIAGVKIIINNEKQFDNSMLSKLNKIKV